MGALTDGSHGEHRVNRGQDVYRLLYRNLYRTGRYGVEAVSTLQHCGLYRPS